MFSKTFQKPTTSFPQIHQNFAKYPSIHPSIIIIVLILRSHRAQHVNSTHSKPWPVFKPPTLVWGNCVQTAPLWRPAKNLIYKKKNYVVRGQIFSDLKKLICYIKTNNIFSKRKSSGWWGPRYHELDWHPVLHGLWVIHVTINSGRPFRDGCVAPPPPPSFC